MSDANAEKNKAIVLKAFDSLFISETTRRQSDFSRPTTFNTALISHPVVRVCSISSRASRQR